MRIIRFLIFYVLVTAMGLIVAVFLGLNHYTVQLDLIATQYSVNVAFVMLGAAAFGFVIALLVLMPGRIAAGLNARALDREVRALDRELRDLEYEIEEREELRGQLLAKHEALLERHERILARHQALLSDHGHTVSERDEARAQLAAMHMARPAIGGHNGGGATALRLLPQPKSAPEESAPPAPAQMPAPRPITPPAVAQAAAPTQAAAPATSPVPDVAARVEPAKQPDQRVKAPAPSRVITPVAPPIPTTTPAPPAAARPAADVEAPAMVPVVTAPPAVAPAAQPKTSKTPKTPVIPAAWRNLPAEARAGVAQTWQSAGVGLVRARRHTVQLWHKGAEQVSAQSKTQMARLRELRQRLTTGPALSGDGIEQSPPDATTSGEAASE